jgi:biopolymer transport protein ExbB
VNGLTLAVENGALVVSVKSGGNTVKSEPGTPLTPGSWQHVALMAAGGQMSLYLNGDLYKTVAAALPASNDPLFIGAVAPAPAFVCEMDELLISKSARAPGWIKLAAASQGSSDAAAKVTTFGPEQQGATGMFSPGGTTAILLSSLTVDGWIVIAILAVMGAVSWWIMYSKVKYMNGIAKGNKAFMNVWKHVSRDLTVIDDMEGDKLKSLGGKISAEGQKAMRQSSVYRIYHTGAEEIRHRKEADGKEFGDRGLSGRSIQAIKASMDGTMVRESQKLSRLIVILTICISGGPFLGLLGTVVGVMITFAAIAAAGDVNVNAIAPGIAAALVATVAGLAVAIPALFGYNYIQSRVKDANTDMHVFIDEFVTKMAEFYPDRRG